MEKIKTVLFGDESDPHAETLIEYTKRTGLLRNTYHVPIIAFFTLVMSLADENAEKAKSLSGRQMFGIFMAHNLILLGLSHMVCYAFWRKENVHRS